MTADTMPAYAYRPAHERGHIQIDWLDTYHTFSFGEFVDPDWHHFGTLRVINEDRVAPQRGFLPHAHRDMEIVTIMLAGELTHKDSMGHERVITANEVQRMTAGTGVEHSEMNAHMVDAAHLLQIWVFPEEKGLLPEYEQKSFVPEGALNQWQLLVSPDGENGSLTIHQQAWFYKAHIQQGHSLQFECRHGNRLWVQVISGRVDIHEHSLSEGDGLGIEVTPQSSASFQCAAVHVDAQVLLIELND